MNYDLQEFSKHKFADLQRERNADRLAKRARENQPKRRFNPKVLLVAIIRMFR